MHLEIEDVEPFTVASVTRRAPMEQIGAAISEGFATVMAALAMRGLEPIGPPLTVYPEPMVDGEPFTVIVAVPIEPGVHALEDAEVEVVPGAHVAVAKHVGSYARLGETYQEIMEALGAQGLQATGGPREIYLSDPDVTPERELVTRIEFPVAH